MQLVCILTLAVAFCGCGYEEVASQIDQRQANEIVATLASLGIRSIAHAERGSGRTFRIEVHDNDYTLAVSILHAYDLPRSSGPTFEELTRPQGLIPNSREVEAARLDYALGVELAEKLGTLPGVERAHVVVRSNLIRDDQQPSASVTIENKRAATVNESDVRRMVQLMVPGISADRIALVAMTASPRGAVLSGQGVENQGGKAIHTPLVPFLRYVQVAERDYLRLAIIVVLCILGAGGLGVLLGFFFGQGYATVRSPQVRVGDFKQIESVGERQRVMSAAVRLARGESEGGNDRLLPE
jgi:type III secretory pathway lipoprotein EscJ